MKWGELVRCTFIRHSGLQGLTLSEFCPGGHVTWVDPAKLKEILFSQPNLLIKTIILNTKSLASGPKHWSWLKPRVYTSILAIVSVPQR